MLLNSLNMYLEQSLVEQMKLLILASVSHWSVSGTSLVAGARLVAEPQIGSHFDILGPAAQLRQSRPRRADINWAELFMNNNQDFDAGGSLTRAEVAT